MAATPAENEKRLNRLQEKVDNHLVDKPLCKVITKNTEEKIVDLKGDLLTQMDLKIKNLKLWVIIQIFALSGNLGATIANMSGVFDAKKAEVKAVEEPKKLVDK